MLTAIALHKNGTLLGETPQNLLMGTSVEGHGGDTDTLIIMPNGTMIVNTTMLASEVYGFAGPVPLRISIKDNIIEKIETGENSETADFLAAATSKIFPHYIGQNIEDALNIQVDAATGATYSSGAINENMRRGLTFAQAHISDMPIEIDAPESSPHSFGLKEIIAIIVILSGAILPIWLKGKGFRWLQLVLNILVLGCWCGTFISYSLLIGYLSNGIRLSVAVVTLLLLVVALLFPLFGKSRHYCMWLCPLGSAQELIFRLIPRSIKISPNTLRWLSYLRWGLWSILMLLMWTGIWFEWMDYELFSIFIFQQASWIVIVMSIAFAILSAFVSRPYCRFLCPTGCLLQTLEDKKIEAQM